MGCLTNCYIEKCLRVLFSISYSVKLEDNTNKRQMTICWLLGSDDIRQGEKQMHCTFQSSSKLTTNNDTAVVLYVNVVIHICDSM